jgi:hypothetical protein
MIYRINPLVFPKIPEKTKIPEKNKNPRKNKNKNPRKKKQKTNVYTFVFF